MVVLEDDLGFRSSGLRANITRVLAGLPASWDVLFLNTCESVWGWRPGQRGGPAGEGSRHIRFLTCTVGYVARRKFALAALRELDLVVDMPVDMELRMLARAGFIHFAVASPPLVW